MKIHTQKDKAQGAVSFNPEQFKAFCKRLFLIALFATCTLAYSYSQTPTDLSTLPHSIEDVTSSSDESLKLELNLGTVAAEVDNVSGYEIVFSFAAGTEKPAFVSVNLDGSWVGEDYARMLIGKWDDSQKELRLQYQHEPYAPKSGHGKVLQISITPSKGADPSTMSLQTIGGMIMVEDMGFKRLPSQTEQEPMITVFPNPATDFVQVETATESRLDLALLDLSGREVKRGAPGFNRMDVSDLNAGLYFLVVEGVSGRHVSRLRIN